MMDNELDIERIKKLFLAYGVKSVSMDDISNELKISKRTLYLFVENKSKLVRTIFYDDHNKFCLQARKIENSKLNPVSKLFHFLNLCIHFTSKYTQVVIYSLNKYYPDLYCNLQLKYRNQIKSIITRIVERGIVEDCFI